MKDNEIIPSILAALDKMQNINFYDGKICPCYAVFHDNINSIRRIFNHSTARQQNKCIYMNPGALKTGLREFIIENVYSIENTKCGYEKKKYLTKKQVDDVIKYLFDNGIITIRFLFEDDEWAATM